MLRLHLEAWVNLALLGSKGAWRRRSMLRLYLLHCPKVHAYPEGPYQPCVFRFESL